jgi:hypothetical protein
MARSLRVLMHAVYFGGKTVSPFWELSSKFHHVKLALEILLESGWMHGMRHLSEFSFPISFHLP